MALGMLVGKRVKGSGAGADSSIGSSSPPAKLQPARNVVSFQETSFGMKDGLEKINPTEFLWQRETQGL